MSGQKEIKIDSHKKESMERFIQLFLKMWLIGFDELEMTERVEAVQLFGEKIEYGIENFSSRLSIIEEKVQSLEEKMC